MVFKFFLLFQLALVHARINVKISGNLKNESDINAHYFGKQADIVSDFERSSFGLRENKLKNAVLTYFGRRPDDVFVRNPTPWGDLYTYYNWNEVTRTLVPKSARVININSEPYIHMMQLFENNSFKPVKVNVGLTDYVDNTVSSYWPRRGTSSVAQINYRIDIQFPNGSTRFGFSSPLGMNTKKYETIKIGASSPMEVILQPGQSVTAELHATTVFIKIEVDYMASVIGSVVAGYSNRYKGQYFWPLRLENLMSTGNFRNEILSREVIEIMFYSQSKVVVCDRRNRTLVEMDF